MYEQVIDELDALSGVDPVVWAMEAGYGDGAPFVRPTVAGIREMCLECRLDVEEPVGMVPPVGQGATVGDVALCTVMAGGVGAHLSVVLACIKALQAPILNALGLFTTTGAAALAIVVNGPIVRTLEFSGGANCLAPSSRSNVIVGRAVAFATRILGGAIVGNVDMATMGQPAKYGLCFAENEEATPFEPLHVERGYEYGESTVTVSAISGNVEVYDVRANTAAEIVERLALGISALSLTVGGSPASVNCEPVVVMSPDWAQICWSEGMSRRGIKKEVVRLSARFLELLRSSIGVNALWEGESNGTSLPATSDILLVVAGGVGLKQTIFPSWNGSRSVTVKIDSIDRGGFAKVC